MTEAFQAIKITDEVYWVGAIDWKLRSFHGYTTHRGTTYNAFLVLTDKITLVDTVKKAFMGEMMSRIASVIPPEKIDYIISNHAEMDHSGALPETIKAVNPEKVFASVKGQQALDAHFRMGDTVIPLKDGETLSLGNANIMCMETRLLHWPDSMFTYLDKGGVLFTQDAFGMHLATSERFTDEVDSYLVEYEAATYYANILMPYSKLVKRQLDKLKGRNLEINYIVPDHGPIFRNNLDRILDCYERWSAQEPSMKAVLAYDTMWGSTEMMAKAIADGMVQGGLSVKMFYMQDEHRSNVASALLEAGAFVVGAPTINGVIFPTIADVLTYIKGLRPQNLVGAAFGSYGWSGESIKHLEDDLKQMKIEMVTESLKCNYVPDNEMLVKCRTVGEKVASKLSELCGT